MKITLSGRALSDFSPESFSRVEGFTMLKKISSVFLCCFSLVVSAADDPGITGDLRVNIQEAMKHHIGSNRIEGQYVLYDAITGQLLRMKLEELHSGIVSKGDFYVSCADFKDDAGNTYDIDFMVAGPVDNLRVFRALVHKDSHGKRKYHLESQ